MVGARGFEPPTSRSQTERTTRLCYAPPRRRRTFCLADGCAILASSRTHGQGLQELTCGFKRTRAVADAILNLWRQFTESRLITIRNKNWIVAEAAGSTRCSGDAAFANSSRYMQQPTIASSDRYDANKSRGSVPFGIELVQYRLVSFFVRNCFADESRRSDAGCATQCINLQTRIIRQGERICLARVVRGFKRRIFSERCSRFRDWLNVREICECEQFEL